MPQRAAVVGTEEYGARRVDGPVVSEPDLLDRSDRLYRVAEPREQLSNLQKGQRNGEKLNVNY